MNPTTALRMGLERTEELAIQEGKTPAMGAGERRAGMRP
jgi:hypothetical protein